MEKRYGEIFVVILFTDMSVTTAPPPTPLPPTYGCTGDWRPYNGYCFQHMDYYEEFAEARKRCQDQGAELASVRDANENGFIAALANEGNYSVMICVYSTQLTRS